MNVRLAFFIARRHLRARRRQTLLSTMGIMVGGGIFALMVAITAGQEEYLRAKLIDVSPHILVTADPLRPVTSQNLLQGDRGAAVELRVNTPPASRKQLKPCTELVARVEALAPDVTAVAPFVLAQGVLRNGTRYQTVTARGIEPDREKNIAQLAASMTWGRLTDLSAQSDGVLIGSGLAAKLKVDVGNTCVFITPNGTVRQLKVVGIFRTGVANFDDRRGYINMALAQTLRKLPRNSVSGLSVQVRDIDRVAEMKKMVEDATGYVAETWQESNAQILEFQARQRITSRLLVIFVFVTAGFGISNTLVAIVLQKKQDIAAMKSFGVTRAEVALIFLFEGAMIGLIGGVLAAALGYGLASLFSSLNLFPQNNDRAFVRFDSFPVSLDLAIYALTFGLGLMMAMTASFLPARRAARFVPVRIIRGE